MQNGEQITVACTGTITDAGTADNTFDVIWSGADEGNYTVESELGTLTVDKAPLTVTTGSDWGWAGGGPVTNAVATLSGLVNGETATIIATGSQTSVGISRNTYEITWGTAKEGNYQILEGLGYLYVREYEEGMSTDAPPSPWPGA